MGGFYPHTPKEGRRIADLRFKIAEWKRIHHGGTEAQRKIFKTFQP